VGWSASAVPRRTGDGNSLDSKELVGYGWELTRLRVVQLAVETAPPLLRIGAADYINVFPEKVTHYVSLPQKLRAFAGSRKAK